MILALCVTGFALTVNAQQEEKKKTTIELPQWVKNIKFSGYGILQYQAMDPYKKGKDDDGNPILEKNSSNAFKLRLARFILDGKIGDFDWRAQIQGTNATGPGQPTVQLVDLYAEWRRFPEFKIRAGQFKRAFTYENPTHPITQGWRGYADVINKLSAFGDRTGEKSSGGRDIGIQFSGDLFPNANGRRLFHYQIGIYNGEGRKTVMPFLLSTLRTNICSVLSISTAKDGVLPLQATMYARLTTARATRLTVGMFSVSCPSSRVNYTPRPVTKLIAIKRNGPLL